MKIFIKEKTLMNVTNAHKLLEIKGISTHTRLSIQEKGCLNVINGLNKNIQLLLKWCINK